MIERAGKNHFSLCFCVSDNTDLQALALYSSPVPELVREPLGASPHLPAPFLGKKIPACLLSAAVKGLVRVDSVWLLMQTSAGGEHGAGWPSQPRQAAHRGGDSKVPLPAGLLSQPKGQ